MFRGDMVLAIIAGRKTQTRRLVKLPPGNWCHVDGTVGCFVRDDVVHVDEAEDGEKIEIPCPYGVPGDLLWVRETWLPRISHACSDDACDCGDVIVRYAADGAEKFVSDYAITETHWGWVLPVHARKGRNVSPLFMPRWASRIDLIHEQRRVERLSAITEADALAEGFEACSFDFETEQANGSFRPAPLKYSARDQYLRAFRQMHKLSAGADPLVWVITFRKQAINSVDPTQKESE